MSSLVWRFFNILRYRAVTTIPVSILYIIDKEPKSPSNQWTTRRFFKKFYISYKIKYKLY